MTARSVPRLHVVTDDAVLGRSDFESLAGEILRAGGVHLALHVRGPHSTGSTVYRKTVALVEVARASGALLAVNDRVDVAMAVGADAVHLGGRSLPCSVARRLVGSDVLMGCSTHDETEIAEAVADGADYVFFGHVFPTPAHDESEGTGAAGVAAVLDAAAGTPVVGIGGVVPSRAGELLGVGAHGLAVLRGVWDAETPEEAVSDYISALGRWRGGAP